MNSKKLSFLISSSIIVTFIVLLTLILGYCLLILFDSFESKFTSIVAILVILSVVLNYFLSKPLLNSVFKGEDNLEKKVKETLHELNIPASTIQINAQMLQKNLKDEKNIKRLERIKQATNELLNLYNVMEYEIKKEIDKVEKQEFDLDEIIQTSIKKFEDIKNDIKIESNISKIVLSTDKNGFQKIIDNLLSNAIKYNIVNGEVKISYKNGFLNIFNTGNSISSKDLVLIFEQYYQIDSSKKGFGLGLHIVKEFCDKHQIKIKIEPKANGTMFILNLSNIIYKIS